MDKQKLYERGDKVKIVTYRTATMNDAGDMDKWLGKTMTVRKGYGDNISNVYYAMEEDCLENGGYGWAWTPDMIEEPDL